MYAQFFGSYLLNKGIIDSTQLTTAISKLTDTHIKLGTLAMHKGYMTADEVDEVCYIQTREDRRFGEIALDRCYLFEDQLEDLLDTQVPGYLKLSQTMIDLEYLTNTQLEELMVEYEREHSLDYDETISDYDPKKIVGNFFNSYSTDVSEQLVTYMTLLFNNLVRFIGSDFTPLEPIAASSYSPNYCTLQKMTGPINISVRLDMEEESTAIEFAQRYADMEFDSLDEYVMASLEDFLNLHNGLYSVNLSNSYSMELKLEPPVHEEDEEIDLGEHSQVIPIYYPFGKIFVIVSFD